MLTAMLSILIWSGALTKERVSSHSSQLLQRKSATGHHPSPLIDRQNIPNSNVDNILSCSLVLMAPLEMRSGPASRIMMLFFSASHILSAHMPDSI